MDEKKTLRRIRICLILFLLGILFSLHTVVFVESETALFAKYMGQGTFMEKMFPSMSTWMDYLHVAISQTYSVYPVIAYCMDWLSYCCIVFAFFIIGAIKDPIRNVWIVQTYMMACLLAALLPFVAGTIRGLPIFWRFIDGSFGVAGFLFLLIPYRMINKLTKKYTPEGSKFPRVKP